MSSTTPITTAQSSPKKPVDDQKKVTENEQIPNSNQGTSHVDQLLEQVIGDEDLTLLSLEELDVLLNQVDFLEAVELDTGGGTIPNNGNNQNSTSTSSLTSSPASSPTSRPTSSFTSSFTSSPTPSPTRSLTSSSTSSSTSSVSRPDLVGSFGTINLPSTVNFGAQGSAKVIVTNQGQASASGPSTVKLYISTDGEIDSNDRLLTSVSTNLNLNAGQSVTLDLTYNNNTSVIAAGAYFLIAQVDANNQIPEQLETNNVTSKLVSGLNTNAIIDWNAIALNAIQAEGEQGGELGRQWVLA